jgi:hypothetical protein
VTTIMTSTQAASDTPDHCIADFSLIPVSAVRRVFFASSGAGCFSAHALIFQIGSEHASFSNTIAGIHDLVQESGLKSYMHATGTIVGKNIVLCS